MDAISKAIQHYHTQRPHDHAQFLPYRPDDIRERTMWFLGEHSKTHMTNPNLCGLSFSQQFRAAPPSLSFHHRDDERQPDSWAEYCTLMADVNTFPDRLFATAIAVTYQCHIILFFQDDSVSAIMPGNAFRRIFLFASDDFKHFNWGAPLAEHARLASMSEDNVHEWQYNAFQLQQGPSQWTQSSLSNALQLPQERLEALHRVHCAYSGHPGVKATVKLLQAAGFNWRRMTANVTQFIKRCPTCNSSRLRLQYAPTSAAILRLHAKPLRRWHIDSTGIMGECAYSGFTLLIAFICKSTQFTVLFGSRHGTALETAIALIQLIGWLGLPESIHSDGGKENDNYIWHQVEQITGIKHTLSVPYIPQTNGIAERNIGTAKRFLRSLTADMHKHNSWGLLLPITQRGMHSIKREELQWHSPNDIVFANLLDTEVFVLPTFYSRPLRELDLANAHAFTLSANCAHRAMCFQQMIVNAHHEMLERAFDKSSKTDPIAYSDLSIGQSVLIDWPRVPCQLHPQKRGPFKVVDISHNCVSLEHHSSPPPQDQPATLLWSKHAHVYTYADFDAPSRSAADPAASQVPTGSIDRRIDCVISHSPKPTVQGSQGQYPRRNHVADQLYECRL